MNVIAAFETSTRFGSVAAVREEDPDSEIRLRPLERQRAHASDLLPTLEALLAELGATPRELGALIVGTGPGSFTGLRVASATALGLSHGGATRTSGLPSFEALVFERVAPEGTAVFLLDARAGGFYFAHYARTVDDVDVRVAPCVLAPEEARERCLGEIERGAELVGDAQGTRLLGDDAPEQRMPETDAIPSAGAVLALGRRRLRDGRAEENVRPLYLRAYGARTSPR